VIDFDAESKYGFRPTSAAENQSVSNDGEMLARCTNFSTAFFRQLSDARNPPSGNANALEKPKPNETKPEKCNQLQQVYAV
jgi:hypothetical protein